MLVPRFLSLFLIFILMGSGSLSGDIPQAVKELQYAGTLRMDRAKLEEAWRMAATPEVAASLTNVWLFETNFRLDEELLGTPPFLAVLSAWEEKEPNNGLVCCLRTLFLSSRASRFPDWDRLGRALGKTSKIDFHYAPVRRGALAFLMDKRGNTIETWMHWLNAAGLNNVDRIIQLAHSCLMEARFLRFTGEPERANQVLAVAERIARLILSDSDVVKLRQLSVLGGVYQEKIITAISIDGLAGCTGLMAEFRGNLAEQEKVSGRLSVLTGLQKNFTAAYHKSYLEVKPLTWSSVCSVDAPTMAKMAGTLVQQGCRGLDRFWTYRPVQLADFTEDLEKHAGIFSEETLSRASAGRFMDYLRKQLNQNKGMPTWTIPAFARVKKSYANAAGLGRVTLNDQHQAQFQWLMGALSFLTGERPQSTEVREWLKAFEDGKARPYLLLAFAKWRITDAVPVVLDVFKVLSDRAPSNLLMDYAFCLRALTGQNFGLNAQKWWAWHVEKQATNR